MRCEGVMPSLFHAAWMSLSMTAALPVPCARLPLASTQLRLAAKSKAKANFILVYLSLQAPGDGIVVVDLTLKKDERIRIKFGKNIERMPNLPWLSDSVENT